jgi:hypothetical protein
MHRTECPSSQRGASEQIECTRTTTLMKNKTSMIRDVEDDAIQEQMQMW